MAAAERRLLGFCFVFVFKLVKPIVFSLYRNGAGLILADFVVDSHAFLAGSATHCGKVLLSYVTLWNKTRKHGR